MRTLIISDIHGNIDALMAIEEDFDNVICTGDIVDYGPEPGACVDFLREVQVIRARGNHDHAVAFCQDCRTPHGLLRDLSQTSGKYTIQALNDSQTKWLGEAETGVWADHGPLRIFAVHGAPSNHMYKYLTADLPDEEIAAELALVEADIVVTGHTHRPFIKKVDGKLLVNAGSVGQPRDGNPQACYAIIEDGEAEIRRAHYDTAAAAAKIRKMPLAEGTREQLVYLIENGRTPTQAKK